MAVTDMLIAASVQAKKEAMFEVDDGGVMWDRGLWVSAFMVHMSAMPRQFQQ